MKSLAIFSSSGQYLPYYLTLTELEFDAFIKIDRNLLFQQNLLQFDFAVVVLHATSNRLTDLKPLAQQVLATLDKVLAILIT